MRKKMGYLTRKGALLSFVMVRHPLDRLVSAYYDKIVGQSSKTNFKKIVTQIKDKCKVFRQIHGMSDSFAFLFLDGVSEFDNVSPKVFIKFVIDEGQTLDWHHINEHWRPQIANCPFCHFEYSVYGKYETSEEDTAFILLRSNLTHLKKVGKVNKVESHLTPKERMRAFWSAVPVRYLADLKKMFYYDFLLFEYQ